MFRKLLLLFFILVTAPSFMIYSTTKDDVENNIDFIFDTFFTSTVMEKGITNFEEIMNNEINRFSNFIALLTTDSRMDTYFDNTADNREKFIDLSPEEKGRLSGLSQAYEKRLIYNTMEKIRGKVSPKDFDEKIDRFYNFAEAFTKGIFEIKNGISSVVTHHSQK